jgi:bifunctional enzyme CysN/CysC
MASSVPRAPPAKELLRLLTCGSVDDGKSTLIGRLLHDTRQIYEDQLAASAATACAGDHRRRRRPRAAHRRPARRARAGHHDRRRLPLLQHRPPQVHHRRLPGARAVHPQHGDRGQQLPPGDHPDRRPPRRHAADAPPQLHLRAARHQAPGRRHQQDGPRRLRRAGLRADPRDYTDFIAKLDIHDLVFVPMSALTGENVVDPPRACRGTGPAAARPPRGGAHRLGPQPRRLRFPVQLVQRPSHDFRGFAGTIASGVLRRGDEVMVLPSRARTRIDRIVTFDGDLESGPRPDGRHPHPRRRGRRVSRGDMIVHPHDLPCSRRRGRGHGRVDGRAPVRPRPQLLI